MKTILLRDMKGITEIISLFNKTYTQTNCKIDCFSPSSGNEEERSTIVILKRNKNKDMRLGRCDVIWCDVMLYVKEKRITSHWDYLISKFIKGICKKGREQWVHKGGDSIHHKHSACNLTEWRSLFRFLDPTCTNKIDVWLGTSWFKARSKPLLRNTSE